MHSSYSLPTLLITATLAFSSISYAQLPPKPDHCPSGDDINKAALQSIQSLEDNRSLFNLHLERITKFNAEENWAFGVTWHAGYFASDSAKQAKLAGFFPKIKSGPEWVSLNGNDGAWVCTYEHEGKVTIPANFELLNIIVK